MDVNIVHGNSEINLKKKTKGNKMQTTSFSEKLDLSKTKTPTGTSLSCKGWIQEAALRMLQQQLDPEAERRKDLIVYGGRGKAARNVESFHLIVKALHDLNEDETLLVQSRRKPV